MASLNGPVYVPAPNPSIPRYGLFSVATGPLDLPVHARIGGLQYEISSCNLPRGYEVLCQTNGSRGTKTYNGTIETQVGLPFVVYAGIECGTVGLANWGQERIRKYLYEMLVSGEQATVESIVSNQGFGQSPGLGGNPEAVNLGTASNVVQATSILENWLYARYGLPGVIHAPMITAAYFTNAHIVHKYGINDPWCTAPGTKVSFGNYINTAPSGSAAVSGSPWIYITGQVAVWRTPDSELLDIPLGQVINRTTNTVDIVMEREYVVSFDCYVAAVQVTSLAPV